MRQLSLFDWYKTPFKIDKPVRLIELFAGIGSQAKALTRLGADFEHYRVCEFDRYAIKSYNAIHGTNFVTSDITHLEADDLGISNTNKYCYIMTYSFPCQDLSIAGNQGGMKKDSGTRSGLLWEVERLLDGCAELPQVLLMENVTQVHSEDNIGDFGEWLHKLESLGYSNYFQDLSANGFNVPQSRNRCFMVSVLGDYSYDFPMPFKLDVMLKDILEERVERRYFLSDAMINYCLGVGQKDGKFPRKERFLSNLNRANINISNTITTNEGSRPVSTFILGNCDRLDNYTNDYSDNKKLLKILKDNEIRKLTPKECFRLMGFNDADFEKAAQVNTNSQLYKQAGNSIVVDVLYYIFKQMF